MNSYSSSIIGQQMTMEDMFQGSDLDHERDSKRLGEGFKRTLEVMRDEQWHTPEEIAAKSHNRLDSCLRYVRYLKKQGYTVEKRYEQNGIYLYRALRA